MKRTFVFLLSILLVAGLSMISCQKKDADIETTGYGEKAGELIEQAKDTAIEYGEKTGEDVEKAADTVVQYGEKAGEAVEKAADTVVEYGEKAGDEAGKAIEGLGK